MPRPFNKAHFFGLNSKPSQVGTGHWPKQVSWRCSYPRFQLLFLLCFLSFFVCLAFSIFVLSSSPQSSPFCPHLLLACMSADSTKKKGQEKKTDSHRRTYLVRCQPTRPLACLCHHAQADHASMLKAHLPYAEKQKRTAHTLISPKANPTDDLEHLMLLCTMPFAHHPAVRNHA